MKKLHLILFLLVLFALSCNNKQQKKEQVKTGLNDTTLMTNIALNFINDYVSNCNKMKEQIEIIKWVNARPNVSSKFKTELKKMIEEAEKTNPEYGLGFDPIFNAQDYPSNGFKLLKFQPNSNYLMVEAKDWKGFTITMKLKKLDNKWFIDGCGAINIPKQVKK